MRSNNNRMEVLREMEKNMTYESIRFNNKQISDEMIKATVEQYFPKIFTNERWRELTFFTKAMKDEEFYKKIRTLASMQISLEQHLQEMQQRQLEKSKIQDYSSSHGVQELHGNKKMTRAALARRNQQTQQQLRKDQIYVRLTPKTQQSLKWMLCNRKFPRIECKLSCNQHIEYLVNYLSNKWLSSNKGNNRIVLYPDNGSFLKNNLSAKQRQKILKQPLNNFYMFTDVMIGSGIGQNGILNLHYQILEKKKDAGLTGMGGNSNHINNNNNINNSRQNNSISIIENSLCYMDNRGITSSGEKKHLGYIDSHGQMIHTNTYHQNIYQNNINQNGSNNDNNKKMLLIQKQDNLNNNNNIITRQQYVPVGKTLKINPSHPGISINSHEKHYQSGNNNSQVGGSRMIINNNNNQSHVNSTNNNHHQINQSSLLINNAHYSNHFLSNQSNLLNPNRSIYHDEQSIFKSIGFFALGGGNNSYGFEKKNDFHLLTVNSNSFIDVGVMNQMKQRQRQKEKQKQKQKEKQKENEKQKQKKKQKQKQNDVKQTKQVKENKVSKQNDSNKIIVQQKEKIIKNDRIVNNYNNQRENETIVKNDEKLFQLKIQQQQKEQKQQKLLSSSSPRNVKIIKPILSSSSSSSPKNNISFNNNDKNPTPSNNMKQKSTSPYYHLQQVNEIKQESIHDVKKHQQKLIDLRNAINLFQQEGFNQVKNEEISQKQLKQVKTVSIKKKPAN